MDIGAILASVNVIGLAVFGVIIRGMNARIENLVTLAKEQKETLEAVRTRAVELDQMRKDYKQGLEDFQDLGRKIDERRAELTKEQQAAIERKDDELAHLKGLQLEELELRKRSLDRIPDIEARLSETVKELQKQISIVSAVPDGGATGLPKRVRPLTLLQEDDDRPTTQWVWLIDDKTLPSETRKPKVASRSSNVKLTRRAGILPDSQSTEEDFRK